MKRENRRRGLLARLRTAAQRQTTRQRIQALRRDPHLARDIGLRPMSGDNRPNLPRNLTEGW